MTPMPLPRLEQNLVNNALDGIESEKVPVSVETIRPACSALGGHRLGLAIESQNSAQASQVLHNDAIDPVPANFAGANTGHAAVHHPPFLLVPVIPSAISRENAADA